MQNSLQNRLKRAMGQMDALLRLLDDPTQDCRDVLVRAKTIRQALDGFATAYIEEHMELCMRQKMNATELSQNLETALKYFS